MQDDTPRNNININSKRKSVFLPLLIEQNLVKSSENDNIMLGLENDEINKNLFKAFSEIIFKLDEKSVLLCKFLSNILSKYSKFVPINIGTKNKILNSRITDDDPNEASNDSCNFFLN